MQSAAVLLFTVGAAAAAGTGAASLRSAGAQAALLETESHMRARTRAKAMTQELCPAALWKLEVLGWTVELWQ